jgi:hypothetical protein
VISFSLVFTLVCPWAKSRLVTRRLNLVALATDKFISELVYDAKALGELRRGEQEAVRHLKRPVYRIVSGVLSASWQDPSGGALTMEDLSESLRSKGVRITKPTAGNGGGSGKAGSGQPS